MANTYRHRAGLLAGALALLGLLTACGGSGSESASAPTTLPGTAAPATSDESAISATPSVPPSAGPTTTAPTSTPPSSDTRCHTSELEATLGRNEPGAGQENFPLILTNTSSRTCTVHGYPGAAFVDADGRQLGPDPKRTPGDATTLTLAPGERAWSGITFSNPEISGARTANPDALLVTPPDERDSLKVSWSAGEVPVSGNESSVYLTVFDSGPGA